MSEDQTTNAPSSSRTIDDLTAGMELQGTVKAIQLYGAFVDIGIGQDALLHISQLGKQDVRNVEDVLKIGDTVTVYVLKIDKAANRVALSMEPTPSVTWDDVRQGQNLTGKVVRIEDFGVFVDIGAERPGMVHVSELAEGYVKTPSDVVSMGQEVQVRVIKVNRKKRQIDLSMKEPQEEYVPEVEEGEELPTAMELAFRKAQQLADDDDKVSQAEREKRNKERRKREQEDIIARTLRNHSNN